jgi:hypothetical protein
VNKYEATSAGAIVGIFVAGLIGQGAIPLLAPSDTGFSILGHQ